MSQTDISQLTLKSLFSELDQCLHKDKFSIKKLLQKIKHTRNKEIQSKLLADAAERISHSIQVKKQRASSRPEISYPTLPVSEQKDAIKEAIENNQVVIIAGETGSGKTTQLPKICLELGRGVNGLIAHTQPRRLAARSVASRIAEELKTPLGEQVGFKIRFSDKVSDSTYIKLMTDGMLLAEMQQDRYLNQYDTIIIDEAHERSLNIDFLLGYLKQLLIKRPELKLIVTSATIDPERFSKHFFDAPIIEVSGRTYPVEVRYSAYEDAELDQTDAIIQAVDELDSELSGDILVFLSGEREIRDTQDALEKQKYRHTEIVPLYARLSASEQNRIFQPHGGRRIVLATNVAETSLTVPGIKYVIDPGTARISRYSAKSKVQRLPIEPISQASANQRAGRCGRVSEGICIRLYSEDDYLSRPEFTDPEILRTNLGSVILQMLALGLGDITSFDFVQPPENRNINDGFKLLEEIQAVSRHKGKMQLTQLGRKIAKLPVDPRYARMIIESDKKSAVMEVMVIAAGLSIQDPKERPQDKKQAADECHAAFKDKESDFISLLNLWNEFIQQQSALSQNQLRRWCKSHFINYLRMREWQDIVSQLKKSIVDIGITMSRNPANYQSIHESICSGLLSHIGFKDKDREYLGARNSRFLIFPGSGLTKAAPKWIMSAELVETSRLFGRMNAKLDVQWIEPLAKHLSKVSHSEPHWSKKRGAVVAIEKVTLYGLPIVTQRHVVFSNIDPVVSQQLFVQHALVQGETKLNFKFLQHNLSLLEKVDDWEQKTRRRDLLVDEQKLIDFYVEKLPVDVNNEASLKKYSKKHDLESILKFTEQDVFKQQIDKQIENELPNVWKQGNLSLPLSYCFEPNAAQDGVTATIPLPLLNQVENVGFDWLVPGLREELILSLIKSLPKKLRRNFVPAPDYASACVASMEQQDKKGNAVPLIEALTTTLFRMTGVKVEPEQWQQDTLSTHLVMHFSVVDANEKVLAVGDDLNNLKLRLQNKVQATFEKAVTPELERKNLTTWDFDSLPESFTQKHGGFEVQAYPALVLSEGKVNIELIDDEYRAQKLHQLGVNSLLKLSMPSPVRYLENKLPNKSKLGLYFNPFGQINPLIDDCILAGIDALVDIHQQQTGNTIRTKAQFDACLLFVRTEINEKVLEIATKVEQGLTLAHQCQKKMKGNIPLNMISALGAIKQHLSALVYPGFVAELSAPKLEDWIRYLKALLKRLEKLPIDPNKDRLHQLQIDKAIGLYEKKVKSYNGMLVPEQVLKAKWMIEEFRVSLFAQQLGTAYPISLKRIEQYLQDC